jgi:hypothetical protein
MAQRLQLMSSIRCFMIDDTGVLRRRLRRFTRTASKCVERGYHDAGSSIFEDIARDTFTPDDEAEFLAQYPCNDPAWPARCRCGYAFSNADAWGCSVDSLWCRRDTGEAITLRDAPPGAMWFANWMEGYFNPQLGTSPLVVMTPGGDWTIDSQASNCTIKDDYNQERHHCWVAHGVPPDVTVDKNGNTCAAGAGSIQCGSYHGFLRNGYLVTA